MKTFPFALIFSVLLALGLAQVAPYGPGTALSKLRRAAEALDDILEGEDIEVAVKRNPACWQQGQPCAVARQETHELAGAIAEARAAADPASAKVARDNTPEGWCDEPGNYCDKVKRQISALEAKAEAETSQDQHLERRALDNDEHDAMLNECMRPGQECFVARGSFLPASWLTRARSYGSLVHKPNHCHQVGEPCLKLKRAQDLIVDLAASEEGFDNPADNAVSQAGPARRALITLGREVAKRQQQD